MQKTVNSKIENYLRNYSHLFGLRFFRNYKQTKKKMVNYSTEIKSKIEETRNETEIKIWKIIIKKYNRYTIN